MNKQTLFLVSVAVVLGTLYIANFTDWFKHRNIQISWRISPVSGEVVFYLDKAYRLASVEVVSTEEAKTNKYPHALWHIIAQPDTAPTKTFNYGASIPGMKPTVATALPEPLERETDYSLLVKSGNGLMGESCFSVH